MKVLSDFTLALMFNSKEKRRLTAGDAVLYSIEMGCIYTF